MNKFTAIIWLLLLLSAHTCAQHSPAALDLLPRAGGTLYLDASLGADTHVSLLVDTGASLLTVNKQTFDRVSKYTRPAFSHAIGLRNAQGKVRKVKVYILPALTLGTSCELSNVEIAVMPSGSNILGMNVLSRLAPFSLSIHPPRLAFSHCDSALIADNRVPN